MKEGCARDYTNGSPGVGIVFIFWVVLHKGVVGGECAGMKELPGITREATATASSSRQAGTWKSPVESAPGATRPRTPCPERRVYVLILVLEGAADGGCTGDYTERQPRRIFFGCKRQRQQPASSFGHPAATPASTMRLVVVLALREYDRHDVDLDACV